MNKIKTNIKYILCLITILLIPDIYTVVAAAPVAEKPVYSEGDSWVFVNRNKFKKRKHIFLGEEKDKYVFKVGKSNRTSYIYFTSNIKGTLTGYRNPVLDFPITVGKKWDHKNDIQRVTPSVDNGRICHTKMTEALAHFMSSF